MPSAVPSTAKRRRLQVRRRLSAGGKGIRTLGPPQDRDGSFETVLFRLCDITFNRRDRPGRSDGLAANGGGCDRISLRRTSVRPRAPISGEYRKTAGGNDEPRTDAAAARVGTWSR